MKRGRNGGTFIFGEITIDQWDEADGRYRRYFQGATMWHLYIFLGKTGARYSLNGWTGFWTIGRDFGSAQQLHGCPAGVDEQKISGDSSCGQQRTRNGRTECGILLRQQ